MSLINKENIFTILREYHENVFPAAKAGNALGKLRTEFQDLEDKVISMVVNLVSGKSAFMDASGELLLFQEKINVAPQSDPQSSEDKAVYASKIKQLLSILNIAKNSSFKLKVSRVGKVLAKKV